MVTNVFDFIADAIETENWGEGSLQNLPPEYRRAYYKAEDAAEKVKAALPSAMQDVLSDLEEQWETMETLGRSLYYRRGFSDALRLIFQTLLWEVRKH